MLIGASGLAVAALATTGALVLGGSSRPRTTTVPTSLATVVRTDVVQRQQVSGTLGFTGSFTVTNGTAATVPTWLPAPGAVVRRGRALYELDRRPVPLLYAYRPAFRAFELGMTPGLDVRGLQQNLRALGYDAGGALRPNGRFDLATLAAVEAWQRSLGLAVTGLLPLGSVAFLPGPVRVGAVAAVVGGTLQPAAPILTATATRPAVLVSLDPSAVAQLAVGGRVVVTMPDGSTANGRVASIGRVATAPGDQSQGGGPPPTPTVAVTIRLLGSRGTGALDQAPVQVAITVAESHDVLAVPISALVAQPGGGYAVDVQGGTTTRLLPVHTGLFDDLGGRVEVSGPGLQAGMQVEVPTP